MFKNITKKVLSFIFNYYYDKQTYHDLDLPLKLSEFDSIGEAININMTNDSICIEMNNGSYFLDYVNLEHFPKKIHDYLVLNNCVDGLKMSFKDAPYGARFRYPNMSGIWVKINSHPKSNISGCDGNVLIAKWNGNVQGFQSYCSFCDEESGIDFNTEIELV